MFVATKVLSRQTHVCCNKSFVTTDACLLQQKFCHDRRMFVATKVMLVAAPASDSPAPDLVAKAVA